MATGVGNVEMVRRAYPTGTFMPGDQVSLTVYEGVRGAKEIETLRQAVAGDGTLTFDRLGTIEVAGESPEEVERRIRSAALRSERPLGVNFTTHFSALNNLPVVELRGGVARPGVLTLGSAPIGVRGAIGMAGGLSDSAGTSTITLVREGRRRPILVGSANYENLTLRAGDKIVVD